jgi:hypothetical protein
VAVGLLVAALTEPGDPPLVPLPPEAAALLVDLDAPPRLGAHLRLVHDVAHQLTARLTARHPHLRFDRDAVLFGAATHDIGKVLHVEELTGPGIAHEAAGQALLLKRGVPRRFARFAGTHGRWAADGTTVEDLLVSVADQVWRAKRVPDLETLLVDRLASAAGVETWEAFMDVDDILEDLSRDADRRLAFQTTYPV